jgi:hypothetical protein
MSKRTARPSWLKKTVTTGMCALTTGAGILAAAPAALATYPGDNGVIAFSRDGDIWTVAPDGGGEHRLTFGPDHDVAPEWSRDGKELLFERNAQVFRMRADGSGITFVHEGSDPQLSPSGKRIAFSWQDAIWVADADGTDARKLEEAGDLSPELNDWAPTHSLLLYTLHDDDSIFTAKSPEGSFMGFGGLHDDYRHENNIDPSWSPDGTRLAFVTQYSGIGCDYHPAPGDKLCPTGHLGVNTMDLGEGDRQRVQPTGHDPVYSPDGTRLAFVADGVITTVATDGSGLHTLVAGTQPDWQPTPRAPQTSTPPPERVVTVPGPTVTVEVPVRPPARGTSTRTRDGAPVCVVPKGRQHFTLTLRAGRTIRAGKTITIQLDLARGPRSTVLDGKRLGARAALR